MPSRIAAITISALLVALPFAAMAQNAPYSQVVISTQILPGTANPSVAPIITVTATSPSMAGVPQSNAGTLSYATSFNNDIRTVTFIPGSYNVVASGPAGYYFSYSPECSGFTPLSGATRGCTVLMSTTPPAQNNCPSGWYNNGTTCVPPTTPYNGPTGQAALTCGPTYQSIQAGQAATFTATGGTGSYSWTTPTRTSLNVGPSFSTTFQTTGTQTVIVSSGVYNAACTINVIAGSGAISYNGSPAVTSNYVPSTNYVSALLPNTGFEPQNGAAFAFALVMLVGAGIVVAPYVRKAFTAALG
jgi:hypothetical protein